MNKQLLELINKYCTYGDYVLSSGKKSNKYFNIKKLALTYEGVNVLTTLLPTILNRFNKESIVTAGGMSFGADPISHIIMRYMQINMFSIRDKKKTYGLNNIVEGIINENNKILLVDDVITTGTSILKAFDAIKSFTPDVVSIVCILFRGDNNTLTKIKKECNTNNIYYLISEDDIS